MRAYRVVEWKHEAEHWVPNELLYFPGRGLLNVRDDGMLEVILDESATDSAAKKIRAEGGDYLGVIEVPKEWIEDVFEMGEQISELQAGLQNAARTIIAYHQAHKTEHGTAMPKYTGPPNERDPLG